jgi:hypothetical protein
VMMVRFKSHNHVRHRTERMVPVGVAGQKVEILRLQVETSEGVGVPQALQIQQHGGSYQLLIKGKQLSGVGGTE